MRFLFLAVLVISPAGAEWLRFGVKGGVPVTDAISVARETGPGPGFRLAVATTRRYTVGPTVELRLPFNLGLEFDALYRRFGYDQEWNLIGARTTFRTTVNAWQFPLLAKFRWEAPLSPFLAGGISYGRLAGMKQLMDRAVPGPGGAIHTTSTSSAPMELADRNAAGATFAAGFELPVPKVRVAPEVRFTHWSGDQIRERNDLVRSVRNQAEVLIGITF